MWKIPVKQIEGGVLHMFGFGTSRLTPEKFTPTIKHAVKEGIRHIDTASYYKNFHLLQSALEEVYQENIAKRSDLFLVSKAWGTQQRDVRKSCEDSLKGLNTDYIDLFMVHWPWCYKEEDGVKTLDFVPRHKVWRDFERLVDEGMVRFIGVCNYNCIALYDLLSYCNIKPVVNQVELHIYNQQPELVSFCQQQDVLPIAFAPLGSNAIQAQRGIKFDVFKEPIIHGIAQKHNATYSQIMLAWLRQRGVGVVPKTSQIERLDEQLGSLKVNLDNADMQTIKRLNWNMRLFESHFEYFFPVFK